MKTVITWSPKELEEVLRKALGEDYVMYMQEDAKITFDTVGYPVREYQVTVEEVEGVEDEKL